MRAVRTDLEQNHGRKVAASYIQYVAEWVGNIATAQEEDWEYEMPALNSAIATVAISFDGAMIPMADGPGHREALVETLSFHDGEDERQHTIHLAAAPEYGKSEFKQRMAREIARAKKRYPEARYLGIADGAASNWRFLEQHTQRQLIGFSMLRNMLARLLTRFTRDRETRPSVHIGITSTASSLRTIPKRSTYSLARPRASCPVVTSRSKFATASSAAWSYFTHHHHRMDYPGFSAEGLPIGSGVTEAACKTLVKQRLWAWHALEEQRGQACP